MLINLTPHKLNIRTSDNNFMELASSGVVRVKSERQFLGTHEGGVKMYTTSFGEVEGLPEPVHGVIFVVSLLVKQACPKRKDLASPGTLIRDEEGRPIGCDGLNM